MDSAWCAIQAAIETPLHKAKVETGVVADLMMLIVTVVFAGAINTDGKQYLPEAGGPTAGLLVQAPWRLQSDRLALGRGVCQRDRVLQCRESCPRCRLCGGQVWDQREDRDARPDARNQSGWCAGVRG